MNNSQEPFDREAYEHETDIYVSDCNRLPFEKPFFKWKGSKSAPKRTPLSICFGWLVVAAIFMGGIWGIYLLVGKLIAVFS